MEVQVIYTQEILGRTFNIYETVEKPLFLAKDVAEWIEHSNTRMMLKSIDDEEKLCVNNLYASSGQQKQWFLTEDGLYEVLMQSRKPIAKQFKKKIKEILKKLRLGEIQIIEGGNTVSNELTTKDMQTLVQSVVESNNNTATCMQQMTQMMGIMLQLLQNNTSTIQQNNNTTTEIDSEDKYIKSNVKAAVGKYYTMSQIADDINHKLNITSCNSIKLNRYLCNNGILTPVDGFRDDGIIYKGFYIFTEDYRDKYNSTLIPSKDRDGKPYLNTKYDGKCRAFIIKYITDNIEDFINS